MGWQWQLMHQDSTVEHRLFPQLPWGSDDIMWFILILLQFWGLCQGLVKASGQVLCCGRRQSIYSPLEWPAVTLRLWGVDICLYSLLTSPGNLWLGVTWQWRVLCIADSCHDQVSSFGLKYILMSSCFKMDVPALSFNYISASVYHQEIWSFCFAS